MTLKQVITLQDFKPLWVNGAEYDFSSIGEYFYNYYGDDELKINSNYFTSYWNIFIKQDLLVDMNYEFKKWKSLNAYDPSNKSTTTSQNRVNGTNNNTINNTTTNNGTNSNNSTLNSSKSDGFKGFSANNQTNKFQTNTENTTNTSNDTINNTTTNNGTNNNVIDSTTDITTTHTNTNITDMHKWFSTNFETVINKYLVKIVNRIFIEVW